MLSGFSIATASSTERQVDVEAGELSRLWVKSSHAMTRSIGAALHVRDERIQSTRFVTSRTCKDVMCEHIT